MREVSVEQKEDSSVSFLSCTLQDGLLKERLTDCCWCWVVLDADFKSREYGLCVGAVDGWVGKRVSQGSPFCSELL